MERIKRIDVQSELVKEYVKLSDQLNDIQDWDENKEIQQKVEEILGELDILWYKRMTTEEQKMADEICINKAKEK